MKLPKIPDYFSRQAQVAMLGYVVLAVAILLPVNIEKEEYNLSERVISLLMMLLPMVVSIYTINCLVRGSSKGGLPCDVLAWLNSGSILVWSVLVLVLTLLLYANSGNGATVKKVVPVKISQSIENGETVKTQLKPPTNDSLLTGEALL
jgi:hypothetical protein